MPPQSGKISKNLPFQFSHFVFYLRENSKKFVVGVFTKNLAFNLSGAFFFVGLGCSLKWWYKDQLLIVLLKQNLPALSEPEQKISWELGNSILGNQGAQKENTFLKTVESPIFINKPADVNIDVSSLKRTPFFSVNPLEGSEKTQVFFSKIPSVSTNLNTDVSSSKLPSLSKTNIPDSINNASLVSAVNNKVNTKNNHNNEANYELLTLTSGPQRKLEWGKNGLECNSSSNQRLLDRKDVCGAGMHFLPVSCHNKGFHNLIERIDLYATNVFVNLKSPWQKHAYQRFVGVFSEPAQLNKLKFNKSFSEHTNFLLSRCDNSDTTCETFTSFTANSEATFSGKNSQLVDNKVRFKEDKSLFRIDQKSQKSKYTLGKPVTPLTWFKLSARGLCILNQKVPLGYFEPTSAFDTTDRYKTDSIFICQGLRVLLRKPVPHLSSPRKPHLGQVKTDYLSSGEKSTVSSPKLPSLSTGVNTNVSSSKITSLSSSNPNNPDKKEFVKCKPSSALHLTTKLNIFYRSPILNKRLSELQANLKILNVGNEMRSMKSNCTNGFLFGDCNNVNTGVPFTDISGADQTTCKNGDKPFSEQKEGKNKSQVIGLTTLKPDGVKKSKSSNSQLKKLSYPLELTAALAGWQPSVDILILNSYLDEIPYKLASLKFSSTLKKGNHQSTTCNNWTESFFNRKRPTETFLKKLQLVEINELLKNELQLLVNTVPLLFVDQSSFTIASNLDRLPLSPKLLEKGKPNRKSLYKVDFKNLSVTKKSIDFTDPFYLINHVGLTFNKLSPLKTPLILLPRRTDYTDIKTGLPSEYSMHCVNDKKSTDVSSFSMWNQSNSQFLDSFKNAERLTERTRFVKQKRQKNFQKTDESETTFCLNPTNLTWEIFYQPRYSTHIFSVAPKTAQKKLKNKIESNHFFCPTEIILKQEKTTIDSETNQELLTPEGSEHSSGSNQRLLDAQVFTQVDTEGNHKLTTSEGLKGNLGSNQRLLESRTTLNSVDTKVAFATKKSRFMSGYVYPDIESNLLKANFYRWIPFLKTESNQKNLPLSLTPYGSQSKISKNQRLLNKKVNLSLVHLKNKISWALCTQSFQKVNRFIDQACLTGIEIPVTPTTLLSRYLQQQGAPVLYPNCTDSIESLDKESLPVFLKKTHSSSSNQRLLVSPATFPYTLRDQSFYATNLLFGNGTTINKPITSKEFKVSNKGFGGLSPLGLAIGDQLLISTGSEQSLDCNQRLLESKNTEGTDTVDSIINKISCTVVKKAAFPLLETKVNPSNFLVTPSYNPNYVLTPVGDKNVYHQELKHHLAFFPGFTKANQFLSTNVNTGASSSKKTSFSSSTKKAQGDDVTTNPSLKSRNSTDSRFIIEYNPRKTAYNGIVVQRNKLTKDFQFLKESTVSPLSTPVGSSGSVNTNVSSSKKPWVSTAGVSIEQHLGWKTAFLGPENPLTDRQSHFFGQRQLDTIDTTSFQRDYLRQLGKETVKRTNCKSWCETSVPSVERSKILSFSKTVNSFSLRKHKYACLLEDKDQWHLLFQEQLRAALEDPKKYPPLTTEQTRDHVSGRIKVSAPLIMARFPKKIVKFSELQGLTPEGSALSTKLFGTKATQLGNFPWRPPYCLESSQVLPTTVNRKQSLFLPKTVNHYPAFTEKCNFELTSIPWFNKNGFSFSSTYGRQLQWFTQEPLTRNSWAIMAQWSFLLALLFWVEEMLLNNVFPALFALEQLLLGANGLRSSDRANVIRVSRSDTPKFKNIAGVDGLLGELAELVLFLRGHKKRLWNKKSSYGVLLTGSPGTGKTFLVRALANEARVPVLILSAGTLTANRINNNKPSWSIRHAFRRAKQLAPCILFIDEIDALGRSRGNVVTDVNEIVANARPGNNKNQMTSPANTWFSKAQVDAQTTFLTTQSTKINADVSRTNFTEDSGNRLKVTPNFTNKRRTGQSTDVIDGALSPKGPSTIGDNVNQQATKRKFGPLTQLLVSMDGVSSLSGVLIMGATNRPESLDAALTRPGRFERTIHIEKPTEQKRVEILQLYSQNLGIKHHIPWSYLANRTRGLTAADLAVAMNYSSLKAITQGSKHTIETIEHGLNSIARLPNRLSLKTGIDRLSNPVQNFSKEKGKGEPFVNQGQHDFKKFLTLSFPVSSSSDIKGQEYVRYFDPEIGKSEVKNSGKVILMFSAIAKTKNLRKQFQRLSQIAYYQAGKVVVQTLLPQHPPATLITLNLSGITTTSQADTYIPINNTDTTHWCSLVESRLIGLYGGKATCSLFELQSVANCKKVVTIVDQENIHGVDSMVRFGFSPQRQDETQVFTPVDNENNKVQYLGNVSGNQTSRKLLTPKGSIRNGGVLLVENNKFQSNIGNLEIQNASQLADTIINNWNFYSLKNVDYIKALDGSSSTSTSWDISWKSKSKFGFVKKSDKLNPREKAISNSSFDPLTPEGSEVSSNQRLLNNQVRFEKEKDTRSTLLSKLSFNQKDREDVCVFPLYYDTWSMAWSLKSLLLANLTVSVVDKRFLRYSGALATKPMFTVIAAYYASKEKMKAQICTPVPTTSVSGTNLFINETEQRYLPSRKKEPKIVTDHVPNLELTKFSTDSKGAQMPFLESCLQHFSSSLNKNKNTASIPLGNITKSDKANFLVQQVRATSQSNLFTTRVLRCAMSQSKSSLNFSKKQKLSTDVSYNNCRRSVENVGDKSVFHLVNPIQFSNVQRDLFYPGWFRLYLPDIESTEFIENVANYYVNLGLQTLTRPSLNEQTTVFWLSKFTDVNTNVSSINPLEGSKKTKVSFSKEPSLSTGVNTAVLHTLIQNSFPCCNNNNLSIGVGLLRSAAKRCNLQNVTKIDSFFPIQLSRKVSYPNISSALQDFSKPWSINRLINIGFRPNTTNPYKPNKVEGKNTKGIYGVESNLLGKEQRFQWNHINFYKLKCYSGVDQLFSKLNIKNSYDVNRSTPPFNYYREENIDSINHELLTPEGSEHSSAGNQRLVGTQGRYGKKFVDKIKRKSIQLTPLDVSFSLFLEKQIFSVGYNSVSLIENEFLFHALVKNSFAKAVFLVDQNRQLIDYFADYLIRFQILRQHQVLYLFSTILLNCKKQT